MLYFFEQVLLALNNEPRTVPEAVDLGIFITSSPDWTIHPTEAWLRGQGWQRTFDFSTKFTDTGPNAGSRTATY